MDDRINHVAELLHTAGETHHIVYARALLEHLGA